MSLETSKKLQTFKGIKKKSMGIDRFFLNLKFNNKKPKYNYGAGFAAGVLVDKLQIAEPIIKSKTKKKIDNSILEKMFTTIIPLAECLVKDFNWNIEDLNHLTEQFFGEDNAS